MAAGVGVGRQRVRAYHWNDADVYEEVGFSGNQTAETINAKYGPLNEPCSERVSRG